VRDVKATAPVELLGADAVVDEPVERRGVRRVLDDGLFTGVADVGRFPPVFVGWRRLAVLA
jgi:hypothetical protein